MTTVDEIKESQALDVDIKTWANAQAWKLSNENESGDISVDYDFDPDNITEGIYSVTFWTPGREFKIHTTDYTKEGQEVGLTFFPEDIDIDDVKDGKMTGEVLSVWFKGVHYVIIV